MARRRRKRETNRDAVAFVPWWGWLLLAAILWAVARFLVGVDVPRKASLPHVVLASVAKAVGFVLTFAGPLACALLAAASAAIRAKTSKSSKDLPERVEPTLQTPPPPVHGDPERDLYEEWKQAGRDDADPVSLDTSKWSLSLLKALEWRRFEQLGALYFRTLRFRVEECDVGPDGGVDLRLFAAGSSTTSIVVQCKAWNSWKVGVKEVRELFGVMAKEGVNEGIFLTSSSFTDEAVAFARGTHITLIDGQDFLKKLCDLGDDDQAHMLKSITSGDFTTPTCPSCGVKMVKRTSKTDGDPFWGCITFPRCRRTMTFTQQSATHTPAL